VSKAKNRRACHDEFDRNSCRSRAVQLDIGGRVGIQSQGPRSEEPRGIIASTHCSARRGDRPHCAGAADRAALHRNRAAGRQRPIDEKDACIDGRRTGVGIRAGKLQGPRSGLGQTATRPADGPLIPRSWPWWYRTSPGCRPWRSLPSTLGLAAAVVAWMVCRRRRRRSRSARLVEDRRARVRQGRRRGAPQRERGAAGLRARPARLLAPHSPAPPRSPSPRLRVVAPVYVLATLLKVRVPAPVLVSAREPDNKPT